MNYTCKTPSYGDGWSKWTKDEKMPTYRRRPSGRLINHGDVPDGGSAYGIRRVAETSNRPSVHCAFRARLCVTNYSESKFHCIHVCVPLGSMKSTQIMRLSELIRKSSCTVQPMEGFRSFFVSSVPFFTSALTAPQAARTNVPQIARYRPVR